MTESAVIRHLLDLCRAADRSGMPRCSDFLTPAEQADFERTPEAGRYDWHFWGGAPWAERRILIAGAREGEAEEDTLAVVAAAPVSGKFAEELGHRDYLGAVLNLGISRGLIGDLVVKENRAWFFCAASAADYLAEHLDRVRNTPVRAARAQEGMPEPDFEETRINIASERLDAVVAAFAGLSRGKAAELIRAEKVFVNGRPAAGGDRSLKEGDILSVRGYGKAVYDGIERETRKGRLFAALRRYS